MYRVYRIHQTESIPTLVAEYATQERADAFALALEDILPFEYRVYVAAQLEWICRSLSTSNLRIRC